MSNRSELAIVPEQPEPECELFGLLEMLSGPWTMHILCLLAMNGPLRFAVLQRHIEGISTRVLTVRLRALERRGLITRSIRDTVPPEVIYAPTPRLEEMRQVIKGLHILASKWAEEDRAMDAA
ncbi:helix-turn-helix domain-containing protein [Neorhizobium sp. NCHU2750]|uniref:winged helix-turn-helix transcriptional regulator n=1 Tax=Neorhizobium sp. NCHU2750 TaxID=1825976 RepID=UPI000E7208DB|nr:hypothetical protein NCHU2750_16640 [Neorhizobium sp. NCHU2750]